MIPTKNYLIVGTICIVSLFIVYYLVSWYNTSNKYYLEHSVMNGFLRDIKEDEIGDYVFDNPNAVIYLTAGKTVSKSKEEEIKRLFKQNSLEKNILFVDIDYMDNNITVILNEYSDKKIDDLLIPNLIIFENRHIEEYLDKDNSVYGIEYLLKKYEVIND